MKPDLRGWAWMLSLCALFSFRTAAAQFVELTADIQTVRWAGPYNQKPPSVQTRNFTVRCVVGANSWLIEPEASAIARDAWWFTGSNIVAYTVVRKYPSERVELFERNHPEIVVGRGYTNIIEARDGGPRLAAALTVGEGVPAGSAQLNVAWLAFCSGPFLRTEGRWIPAPSIEQATLYDTYSDTTTTFKDGLGLPISIELYSTNQPLCHYRTVGSTNVLGWDFPLEFYLAQYRQNYQTRVWEVHMTASGKLKTIGPGSEPSVPTEAQREDEK
jgi:hypothetical protein